MGQHPFDVKSWPLVLHGYLKRVLLIKRHIEQYRFGPVHFIAMPDGILQQFAQNHLDVILIINGQLRHVIDPVQNTAYFPTNGNGIAAYSPVV